VRRESPPKQPQEREKKMKLMKHNFTFAYIGQSGCIEFGDDHITTYDDIDEKTALSRLKRDFMENEYGEDEDEHLELDDFRSIYRGVEVIEQ